MSQMDDWSTLSARRSMRPVTRVVVAAAVFAVGLASWFVLGPSSGRSESDVAAVPAAGMVDLEDGGATANAETDPAAGSKASIEGGPIEGGSKQPDPVALVVSADEESGGSDGSISSDDSTASTTGPDQVDSSTSRTSATSQDRPARSSGPTTSTTTDSPGGSSQTAATAGRTTTTGVATTRPTGSTAPPSTAPSSTGPPTTTRPSTTQAPASDGSGYKTCRLPSGGSTRSVDFNALRRSGAAVSHLNQSGSLLRTVFELGSDRMAWGSKGLELKVDLSDPAATNNRYRAEMRESVIDRPIPAGSTQAYCMRFRADELPDLYGPVHIFQRFNRNLDGPDIGVELTGANQFSNAVPNDIQVVAWDGRNRIGAKLATTNTLLVVVHNHASRGSYKVILNGRVLRERSGLNTVGAAAGGWSQFGIYPHGLYDDDGSNRQDQIDSGRTSIRFEYRDYALTDYDSGSSDLSGFSVG